MIRLMLRFLLSPIVVVAALGAYAVSAFFIARLVTYPPGIHFVGVIGALGVAYLLGKLIEGRARGGGARAWAFAALIATVVTFVMWRYASTPLAQESERPSAESQWHLPTGSTIAFRKCGSAQTDRPPVLFLHGGPAIPPRASSIATVCAIGDAGNFEVYAYDQVGSGASSRLDDVSGYSVARHVSDLEAIRQILGAEKFNVVGVSWGAVLASHYVRAHPGRIDRAIYLSPGVLGPRKGVEYDHAPTASSDNDAIVLPPFRVIIAGLLARANPDAALAFMPQHEAEAVLDILAADPSLEYQSRCKGSQPPPSTASRPQGANYYANLMTAQDLRVSPDPIAAIRAASPPAVLAIRGVCDYIPYSGLDRYRAAYPEMTIVEVENEGHSFLGARPDVIVATSACFLAREAPCEP